jgi:hypothetical protein
MAFIPDVPKKSSFIPDVEQPNPSMLQRFKAGFMEKDIPQPKGFERGDVAEFMGRSGLETIGGAIGGAFGAGIGGVATPIAPATAAWGMGIGAGAGKAVHEGIRRGIGAFSPGSTDMSGGAEQVIGKVVGEGITQGLGGRYLPPIAGKVIKGVGNIASSVAGGISGVSKQAMDAMVDSPSTVLKYIGTTAEDVATNAKAFVSAVEQNANRAGEAYRNIINGIVRSNQKYGADFKIDLASDLSPTIKQVQKDFGYGLPGRVPDKGESDLFQQFADRAGQLTNATVDDAYFFQRDLTNAIKLNKGKPISSALGQLKSVTMGKLSNSVPEIAEANKVYAHAMGLDDELSRVTNADNAVSIIQGAFKNKSNTRDAILRLADESAEVRKYLEGVMSGSAGKEFTPWLRDFPPTGFTAGVGAGGATAAFNPSTIPFVLPLATMLSPRLVGYGSAGVGAAKNVVRGNMGQGIVRASMPPILANKSNLLPYNYASDDIRKKYMENRNK